MLSESSWAGASLASPTSPLCSQAHWGRALGLPGLGYAYSNSQVNCNLLKAGRAHFLSLMKADVQGILMDTQRKTGCSWRSRARTGSQLLASVEPTECSNTGTLLSTPQSFLLNGCSERRGLVPDPQQKAGAEVKILAWTSGRLGLEPSL